MTVANSTGAPAHPPMPETAEALFRATEAELIEQAAEATGAEPIVAAGAFWPNGVTDETTEHGTVGGHRIGVVLGPNLGAIAALAGAFTGHDEDPDRFAMAKPLIVAVTGSRVHIIEPAADDEPAHIYTTFDRATTSVTVKHRGFSRIVVFDGGDGKEFRLHASTAPYMKRSGPEKSVLAELTPRP